VKYCLSGNIGESRGEERLKAQGPRQTVKKHGSRETGVGRLKAQGSRCKDK